MKLTYYQLESHVSKQLACAYLVSGEELILKQDACQIIRKAAKNKDFNERVRLLPEPGFDWEQLYALLYSTSIFAEKRLIELDFRDIQPPKTAASLLQEYIKNPSPQNVLLIDVGKIDDKIAKSLWYTALEKAGVVINIWPIPREQLPQWIIQRGRRYKLEIPQAAANLLANYVEGNLVAAAQAVEKIYLLKPSQSIDEDCVVSILEDESRFSIFDFVENLIVGNKTKTFHILDHLNSEGTEPVLILWAVTRELRLLAELAQQRKQGHSYEEIFQKHRIFSRRQPPMRHFLTKTSVEDCWQYLASAAEIDKIIKGAAPGNAWESLRLFCLRLV